MGDCRLISGFFSTTPAGLPGWGPRTPHKQLWQIKTASQKKPISNRKSHYHRISTPPQVTPPPNEASSTRSPSRIRAASTHSSSAIGIEADEVLPCIAIFE